MVRFDRCKSERNQKQRHQNDDLGASTDSTSVTEARFGPPGVITINDSGLFRDIVQINLQHNIPACCCYGRKWKLSCIKPHQVRRPVSIPLGTRLLCAANK
jgi:hypothetical protein